MIIQPTLKDFHNSYRLRVSLYKLPEEGQVDITSEIGLEITDVEVLRFNRQGRANFNIYSLFEVEGERASYVRATSFLSSPAVLKVDECHTSLIYLLHRMSTPYQEGHDIRFEITDSFVYNEDIFCYSNPQVVLRFRVPYRGELMVVSLIEMDDALLNRFRRTPVDINPTTEIYAPPYNFTKGNSEMFPTVSFEDIDDYLRIRNPFESNIALVCQISNINLRSRLSPDNLLESIFSVVNNSARRVRFSNDNSYNNTVSLTSILSARQRGSSDQQAFFDLDNIELRTRFGDSTLISATDVESIGNVSCNGISTMPSSSTVTCERAFGPWSYIGTYYPGDYYYTQAIRIQGNDAVIWSTNGTIDKLELVQISDQSLTRSYALPNSRRIRIPLGPGYSYRQPQMIAISANYVATNTYDATNRYIDVFNRLTGAYLYSVSSGSTNYFEGVVMTDTVMAVRRLGTSGSGSQYNTIKYEFYNTADGTYISEVIIDNIAALSDQMLISDTTGKLLIYYEETSGSYYIRIYDLTVNPPTFVTRQVRGGNATLGTNKWAINDTMYLNYVNNWNLIDGTTTTDCFDINYNNTAQPTYIDQFNRVRDNTNPQIALYPLSPILSNITNGSELNDVVMNNDYIFTLLDLGQGRNYKYYVTKLNGLVKADEIDIMSSNPLVSVGYDYTYDSSSTTADGIKSAGDVFRFNMPLLDIASVTQIYIKWGFFGLMTYKYLTIYGNTSVGTTNTYNTIVFEVLGYQDNTSTSADPDASRTIYVKYISGRFPTVPYRIGIFDTYESTISYTYYEQLVADVNDNYFVCNNRFYQGQVI